MWSFVLLVVFVPFAVPDETRDPTRHPYPTCDPNVAVPEFTEQDFDEAFAYAETQVEDRRKIERELKAAGKYLSSRIKAPSSRHQTLVTTADKVYPLEQTALLFESAALYLQRKYNLTKEQVVCGLPKTELKGRKAKAAVELCKSQWEVKCVDSRYRTYDGSCNNLRHANWGRSRVPFNRLIQPDYADGLYAPRTSQNGKHPLPNTRVISNAINRERTVCSEATQMVWIYGQFVNHNMQTSPFWITETREMVDCCRNSTHPMCYEIRVPDDDDFFVDPSHKCINVVRRASSSTCNLRPREPMNEIPSYIDACLIYGRTDEDAASLRTNTGDGKLLSEFTEKGGEVLPPSGDPLNDQCSFPEQNRYCFRAGDERANEHPSLTMSHTIWVRQHNRIAEKLRETNPHWDGERIYQEARRIVNAQIQAITYHEFLSVLLGPHYKREYGLSLKRNGFTEYDPHLDATIILSFEEAAYRMGHSMVLGLMGDPEGDELTRSGERLRDMYAHPFMIREGQIPRLIRRATDKQSQCVDPQFTDDVRNLVYAIRGTHFGLDLPAINTQRGRENGVPGYVEFVERLLGMQIRTFEDLDRLMPVHRRENLQKLYRSVRDVDLFIGGISEYPSNGSILGPTFAHINAEQFRRLKFGDRYYFEHGNQTGSFTLDQLNSIRKTTYSKVLCENEKSIESIQRNVFVPKSFQTNPVVPCSSLPDIDFELWKET